MEDLIQFRPIEPEDLEVLRGYINDESVMVSSGAPYRQVSSHQQQQWWEALQKNKSRYVIAIVDKRKELTIGTVGLYDIHPVHRTAQFRIRIGNKSYWGKGVGTSATAYMVDYAFRHLCLRRVWLDVIENNARALAVYEKVGFSREGLLRKAAYSNGQELNVIVMGILAQEYNRKVAKGEP